MEWINFQLHILIKNFIFYKTHEMTKSWSILQDAKQEILQIRLEQVSGLIHIWQTDHYNMVNWLDQNRNCLLVKTKQMRLNFYEVYIVGIYILPVFDEMQTMNDIGMQLLWTTMLNT